MSQGPGAGAAAAGTLLIATILLCAGVGAAIGALAGALAPLTLAGGGVGVIAGFWLVYSRFKEI